MSETVSHHERRIDVWITLGLLGLGLLSVFIANDLHLSDTESLVPLWAEYALTVGLLAPLAWRRRFPLTAAVVTAALFAVYRLVHVPETTASSAALFLTLYAAGALSHHPARDWVRALIVGSGLVLVAWQLASESEYVGFDAIVLSSYLFTFNGAFFVTAWLLGDAARRRARDQAELALRARQLAAELEDRARRAVLDERVRIARELHDVVAHHVSVMGVQAAGARRVLDRDPTRAAEALAAVEDSGRQAVGELHRLVGVLRNNTEAPSSDAQPQPTLDDLDQLAAGAGLPVRLQWIGRARPVPSSVALSAYRIVQESLTNVLKHAGPVPTTVMVTFGTDALQVEVRNARGEGGAPESGHVGSGLLGMRERATMLGGRFEHGVADKGGYRVRATLPTSDAYDREGATA